MSDMLDPVWRVPGSLLDSWADTFAVDSTLGGVSAAVEAPRSAVVSAARPRAYTVYVTLVNPQAGPVYTDTGRRFGPQLYLDVNVRAGNGTQRTYTTTVGRGGGHLCVHGTHVSATVRSVAGATTTPGNFTGALRIVEGPPRYVWVPYAALLPNLGTISLGGLLVPQGATGRFQLQGWATTCDLTSFDTVGAIPGTVPFNNVNINPWLTTSGRVGELLIGPGVQSLELANRTAADRLVNWAWEVVC